MSENIFQFIVESFVTFLSYTWWFLIAFPLWYSAKSAWLTWRQSIFKHDIKWTTLEIRVPRLNIKSPQGMEQVLAAIHSMRNSPSTYQDEYLNGEVTMWYSLEIVSFGGETHFYARIPESQKGLIQSAFFSYYPDCEAVEIADYTDRLPRNIRELYAQGLDVWGVEMLLNREGMYPIKSYKTFESPDEERQFDPMSSFLEVLGKIKADEFIGIQLVLTPADSKWGEAFKESVEKLKDKNKGEPSAEGFTKLAVRSPRETDVLTAVEENLAKPAFEVISRVLYLSPKAGFSNSYARKGVFGAFNQYSANDLNGFKLNPNTYSGTLPWYFPYVFSKRRTLYRKNRLLFNYHHREVPEHTYIGKFIHSYIMNSAFHSKTFFLNLESVASLFHLPTAPVVTAPHMRRMESKKGSPPAGLAIFGEESAIEKFQ